VGCANREQLAIDLKHAARQSHVPRVVACYERAFESAHFHGEYEVLVEFLVAADGGVVRNARVESVSRPNEELNRCLVAALNATSLAAGGFRPGGDVHVSGMRIAFRDTSAETRKSAEETSSNVLIGPRADRCFGLYDHDPPRPAAALFAELSDAQRQAARIERRSRGAVLTGPDPDGYARALQRAYDVALELRKRLTIDSRQADLAIESKKRIRDAQAKATDTARALQELT
jgi:hypothetical protein